MEPTGPVSSSIPPAATRTDATASGWQVGQVLRAVTVASTPGGQTTLQIGNQLVQGQSPIPLQNGQPLSLQVESLTPQPLLRILATTSADPVGNAIRTELPKQGSLAPLLSNLAQLSAARQQPLPPLLQELSRTLLRQLPEPKAVSTPEGLRRAVEQSGLFLESKLLSAGQGSTRLDIGSDFKTNLLRLVQLVRNWPGLPDAKSSTVRPTAPPVGSPPGSPTPGTTPAQTAANTPAGGTPGTGQALPTTAPSPSATTDTRGAGAQPATLARGLQAATPLPAGSVTTSPPPPASASALNTLLAAQPTLVTLAPPLPPMRGQMPLPQARVAASLQALDPAISIRTDLQQQAEAAVARLHLHQLASLPQDKDSGLEWLFELPIRRGDDSDVWSLQIRRDDGQGSRDRETHAPAWTVQLAFDLPGLGPMQARVMLRGEQISTWFWATHEETVPFMQQHLLELRRELENAGLTVAEINCQHGRMPGDHSPAGHGRPLLDERV